MYKVDGAVALITMNRPERMNAMDRTMLQHLMDAADHSEQDHVVRAVVMKGAGKGFSSGFDLKAQAATPPSGIEEWIPVLRRDFDACIKF